MYEAGNPGPLCGPKQIRGAVHVDVVVLVAGAPGAGLCGDVKDGVDASHRFDQAVGVADVRGVAHRPEFPDLGILAAGQVADIVPAVEQKFDDPPTKKAAPTRDQCVHEYSSPGPKTGDPGAFRLSSRFLTSIFPAKCQVSHGSA